MKYPKIRFQGRWWILVDEAITTPDNFRTGKESYAHWFKEQGVVMRFGQQIGTSSDVEVIGEIEVEEPDPIEFFGGISEKWGP